MKNVSCLRLSPFIRSMQELLRESRQNDLQKVISHSPPSLLLPSFSRQDFAMLPRLVSNSWISRDPPPHGTGTAGMPYCLLCPELLRPSLSLLSHPEARVERGKEHFHCSCPVSYRNKNKYIRPSYELH